MISADPRKTTGGGRPRKRVITDARKEQNRLAQQQYRQRLKDRAQNRESFRQCFPTGNRQLVPRPSRGALAEAGEPVTINDIGTETAEGQTQSNDDSSFPGGFLPQDFSQSLDLARMDVLVPDEYLIPDGTLSSSTTSTSFLPVLDSSMLVDDFALQTSFTTVDVGEAMLMSGPPLSNFLDVPVPSQVPLAAFNSSNWPASMGTTLLSNNFQQYELPGEKSASNPLYGLSSIQNTGDSSENSTSINLEFSGDFRRTLVGMLSNQLPGLQGMISATSKFLYGRQAPSNSNIGPTSLPSLYMNYLQCTETSQLLSYFYNAPCIGLEVQDLMHICLKSPFHRPNTTMSDDPQVILAAARKPWIPVHLQPTLAQILIPHHAYLDLLPFPTLRERVITLAATAPPVFRPMDLKKDILRGGLYCHNNYDRPGAMQPWDMRSWEMAPWFLRKWRLLVG